jgi:hypothetical protein
MTKKARLITLISVIIAGGVSLYLVGCDADTTGPTPPEVSYLPQTFSLAVANGSASNDGFAHNGVAVITLDWNNESPGANAVAPKYTYEYLERPYPHLDGSLVSDAATWAQAPETVLTLNNVYGDGGVTTLRVKSLYTFVNPPRIWFLLRWDDAADYLVSENSGYWANHWEYISTEGSAGDRWINRWGNNEDWVAFMWDTWERIYPDGRYPPGHPNAGELVNPRNFYFESNTDGFQSNGCTVTCHEDNGNPQPHRTNGPDQICDVWVWTGTRTNYTPDLANWGSGTNDPAFMFDCLVNQTGFSWGTNDAYPAEEWLTFDDAVTPYVINDNGTGYPDYGDINEPGANAKYLWNSAEATIDIAITSQDEFISPTDDRWIVGDRVAGYLHRTALGGNSDVLGHGGWENGTWTLEVRRNIGGTYDEITNSEDVFLGIFEAHPNE